MLKCHLLKRYHIFCGSIPLEWMRWQLLQSDKNDLNRKIVEVFICIGGDLKKKRMTSKPSQSKNSNYKYRKRKGRKKNLAVFSMLFLLSLELSGLKLNLVLYLIFRLLVGVFFFPKILVCVFVFLLFYFANDHWSLAFFSVWDYVWFQSFFFLLRFIHFNIIRLSVRSLKYLSLKANWWKKILRFVFIIGYWWAEKNAV